MAHFFKKSSSLTTNAAFVVLSKACLALDKSGMKSDISGLDDESDARVEHEPGPRKVDFFTCLQNGTKLSLKCPTTYWCYWWVSPDIVVMGGDSHSEGHGFESQCHILDGHFFTLICCKIPLMLVWKRLKKRKRGRGWPILKESKPHSSNLRLFVPNSKWHNSKRWYQTISVQL